MIGAKTIAALAIGSGLVAIAAVKGALAATMLAHTSAAAWFAIALVASLAVGLVGAGWRFDVLSESGVRIRRARKQETIDTTGLPELAAVMLPQIERPAVRELPGTLQRVLLFAGFASIALAALGNHAAARIAQIRAEMGEPSPSQYCVPHAKAAEPAAEAPAPQVDQAGCALVKRAFQLGYTKSLGSCAPKAATPVVTVQASKDEVCTRRQLDEPYLHYFFRRVAGAAEAATAASPVGAAEKRVDDVRAHVDHLEGLLADVNHAITGSPHAAHHIWIDLPDPHPGRWQERFTGAPRCSQRFADLPLWPHWAKGDEAPLVEHVLGQLLFATRFGSTASCSDYTIHWAAPPDACARLAKDPVGFLASEGALNSLRAVLDRRKRQLELRDLEAQLGRRVAPEPPPVSAIASLTCFMVDKAAAPTGGTVTVDGEAIATREIHVAAIKTEADGPIDVYLALAALLAGTPRPKPVQVALDLDGADFPLTRLDPLVDADPFGGVRAPLQRADLIEIYPFEHHLHAFIDGFRRAYLSQRGRL